MTRFAGALAVLLASGLGCTGSERLDPAALVHPESPPAPEDSDAIELPPPPACADFCGESFLHQVEKPPNLYFLVDRSASMKDAIGPLSKYKTARKVLGQLLDVIGHRVRYGASIFPENTDDCGGGTEIVAPAVGEVPSCDGSPDPTLENFLNAFRYYAPGGSTPTAAAIAGLRSELEGFEGDTYLVLLTDGAPNCDDAASCGADECIPNIEGASQCPAELNCCDTASFGPHAGQNCVDGDATEREVALLRKHHIPTYVVGMPGAAPYADVLNRLAVAGGTARDGDTAYYAANDQSELQAALYAIGTGIAIRCSIDLDAPPDDSSQVNVYFDGELVPSDPDDGWSWDGDTRIQVNGDACARLEAGDVIDARVVFGCDTVVR